MMGENAAIVAGIDRNLRSVLAIVEHLPNLAR